MGLHVGFDVTPRVTAAAGVARYVTELDRALVTTDVLLHRFAVGRARHHPPPGTRWVRVPLRVAHRAWRYGVGSPQRWLPPVDLLHATDLVPPPSRVPVVVTVHDLLALELPDLHPERSVRVQQQTVARLTGAAVVLVPSEATGAAVRRQVPDATVHVTPLAGGDLPAPAAVAPPDGPVVLHVGSLHPRKGLATAVEALAALADRRATLVLVGTDGPARPDVESAAERLGVRDRVHLVGPVDDATLAGWYARATVVVVPTRGEGFGLPVLEALARGVPVVASDLPVLREVAGDTASYVPVGDAEGMAGALGALVADPEARASAAAAGRRRARGFSWEATAVATRAGYERAVAP